MEALFEYHSIQFHTVNKQVAGFVAGLSGTNWNRLAAQCALLADALTTGTPPTGRTAKVRGSRRLWQLSVTSRGGGPRPLLLYAVDHGRVLLLRGVELHGAGLSRRDVKLAERGLAAHESAQGKECV